MKKLIIYLIFLFPFVPVVSQTTDWQKYIDDIINSFMKGGEGGFKASDFSLTDLYDLGLGGLDWGDFMNGIIGQGGSGSLGEGGIFGKGGMFDITPGSPLNKISGNSFGFDEIHNDASLNNNITWAIFHTGIIHKNIAERQKKVIAIQDSINQKVKRLYELEKLTADYLSTKQSDAVDIEDKQDILDIAVDIANYYTLCNRLIESTTGLEYIKDRLRIILLDRSTRIATKLAQFARVDGKSNLLNNEDRDEIVTYVINNLRDMRGTCAYTYKALFTAAPNNINSIESLYRTSDAIIQKASK